MKKIGLAPNPRKTEAVQLASELADWLTSRNVRAVLVEEVAAQIDKPRLAASEEEVVSSDMLLVLGGDGTMLRFSRLAAPKGTPMMGVNFGQYGFITEVHPKEAKTALRRILEGDYIISERVVLKAMVTRKDGSIGVYHALNDAVVSKGPAARMLDLHMFVSGKFIVTYTADGIIVATPTGSTAYSLSAGGPNVSVLIITPICPHTMNARSLVIPDSEVVKIVGECGSEDSNMVLTADGLVAERLTGNEQVEISKADFTAKLVQLEPQSFYKKLQTRLRWGERFSGEQS